MAELNTDVHIFLSSTFIDLKELKERIANRLRDVFGAHLLIMETSGSDDAPPVISSVRRVREADPGLFLLVGSNPSRLTELVRAEETTENFRGRDRDQYEHRAMLVLLRRKAENTPLSAEEWLLFRRYRLGTELVQMINASPLDCPDRLLLWALRHGRPIVRDTAFKAVRRKVSEGRWNWIGVLAKSESARIRFCYQQIVMDRTVPLFPLKLTAASSRLQREFSFLQQIDRAETDTECTKLLKSFKKFRPRAWAWSFASAIAWRYHYRSSLKALNCEISRRVE